MKKRRRRRNAKGIITVFVTLIMVPVVACTGTIVDVARLKLYSSQAAMAADSYGDTVLGEYDNLLKDLYGLFSVTQNTEGLEAINKLAEYTKYSFNPAGDEDMKATGFMPYKDAILNVSHTAIEGATLDDGNVLETQIADFMKFRVIEELLDASGILSSFAGLEAMSADMEAVEKRNEITETSSEVLEKVADYYKALKTINGYSTPLEFKKAENVATLDDFISFSDEGKEGYLEERKFMYEAYSASLYSVVFTEDYAKYNHYMKPENKEKIYNAKVAIDEYAVQKSLYDMEYADYEEDYEQYEKDLEQYNKDLAAYKAGTLKTAPTPPVEPTAPVPPEEPSQETKDLAKQYVDEDAYKNELATIFLAYSDYSMNSTNESIQFNQFGNELEGKFSDLCFYANAVESVIGTLKDQVDDLNNDLLPKCSDETAAGMKEETEELKTITDMAGDFRGVVDSMKSHDNSGKDTANSEKWEDAVDDLRDVEDDIMDGTKEPKVCDWNTTISFDWYDFKTDWEDFYTGLLTLFEKGSSKVSAGEGDENAGQEDINEANTKQAEAQAKMDNDPGRTTRNFTKGLADQVKEVSSQGNPPDITDLFAGDATMADLVNTAVGKFLVTTYDFNMFSSRVSGVEPPEEEDTPAVGGDAEPAASAAPAVEVPDGEGEEEEEEYYDESMTGYKMSEDINYLYGSELEYLVAGKTGDNSSKANQDFTRNVICGVRFATNFASTYSITEINTAIKGVAEAAAQLVALVPYVGPVLSPITRVAVSGAMRAAVATMETAADWDALLKREKVLFYKSSFSDLQCMDIASYLGVSDSGAEGKKDKKGVSLDFEMSYENYLYVMLLIFVSDETLLDRTSNLITLNMNQAQNTSGKDLETLNFKMSKTITAIKSTVSVDLDFVIVPENFLNMFISGSDTEAVIQKLDDGGYGFSVIRGY